MLGIVTITLNPAIDKNYFVEQMLPDHKLRSRNPQVDPGGGGINVSKGIKRLGGESLALFPAGGLNGELLADLLSEESLTFLSYPIPEETRETVVVTELATNKQFRVLPEGPTIGTDAVESILLQVKEIKPAFLIASGSLPKGLPPGTYARFAALAKQFQCKFILDTSGEALKEAVDEGVFLIKPNLNELSELVGARELQLDQVEDAAMEIVMKRNCGAVVVSMGARGAMLVTKEGCKQFPSPTVKSKSTVGAGDSMVAGIVWALVQNLPIEEAVAWGVACGTAATMNEGTQLFRKEDAEKLFHWIKSHK